MHLKQFKLGGSAIANSTKVTSGPCKDIFVFVEEIQQLFFFFWIEGCTSYDLCIGKVFVKRYPFHLTILLEVLFFTSHSTT